jgi:hypothetical protein
MTIVLIIFSFNKVNVAIWTNDIITFGAIGHVHVAQFLIATS